MIGVFCAVAAAIVEYYPVTVPLQWVPYETTFQKAKQENKLVYVDVYAEWCGPCKLMDRTTFANDTVIASLQNDFIATRVNIDDERTGAEVKKKFNIQAMPTSLLLTAEQIEVRRNVGYMNASKFNDWIVETTTPEFMSWDSFSSSLTRAKTENKSVFVLVLQDSLKLDELQKSFGNTEIKRMIKRKYIPTLLLNNVPEHREIIKKYTLVPSVDFIGCIYTFSPTMELEHTLPLRNFDAFRLDILLKQFIAEAEHPI